MTVRGAIRHVVRWCNVLLALGCLGLAQPADAGFIDNGDGTVSDSATGLMWDRCAWGQATNACTGTASEHAWSAALGIAVTANGNNHRNHRDWRLPNINELESLVVLTASNASLDTTAFPNAPPDQFWASTTALSSLDRAFIVNFDFGRIGRNDKVNLNKVRLVRGGVAPAAFDALQPIANAVSANVAYGSSNNAITLNITGGVPTSVAVASAASHGTATASGVGITYTPAAGYSGSDSFTYTATNVEGTSTPATVAIGVSAATISLSPTTLPAGTVGSAYSQTITASGGMAPNAFAVTAGALPAGLSLSTGGVLSGTPTAGGSFNFTITATDSSTGAGPFTGSRAYTQTVSEPVPITNAVSATVAYGSSNNAITLNITGGTPTSVAVASAASHGTATASGVGITYTPAAGYSGSDSFTYTATNAAGTSAAATVSITVNAIYTVTIIASPAVGGTVTCTPNPVAHGGSSTCTAAANMGYTFSGFSGDCTGMTCTLNNVTGARSVTGGFVVASASRTHIATLVSGVEASLSVSGCSSIDSTTFIAPPAGAPGATFFPFGLLDFRLSGCSGTATVTVDYSRSLPGGAVFYKERSGAYSTYPATLGATSVSFTLTDNDVWDGDAAVGTIWDPSGIGAPGGTASIPTLSEWSMIVLSSLVVWLGLAQMRRPQGSAA